MRRENKKKKIPDFRARKLVHEFIFIQGRINDEQTEGIG